MRNSPNFDPFSTFLNGASETSATPEGSYTPGPYNPFSPFLNGSKPSERIAEITAERVLDAQELRPVSTGDAWGQGPVEDLLTDTPQTQE